MEEIILFYNYTFLLFIFNLYIRCKKSKFNIEFINISQALSKIILYSYYLHNNNNFNQVIIYTINDYSLNNLIYIYDKNYELLFHHYITSVFLISAYFNDLSKDCIKILLLFTYSSPILSIAKICRSNNYEKLSNYFFGLFALVFFYYRILLFSYYITYEYINYYNYYSMSITVIGIYLLQFHWMYKIIKIIKK